MRSRQTHDTYCARLNGPMSEHIATTYGISKTSALNLSRYFHVADGLPPDCMHDILEGVLPYAVKMLLLRFVTEHHYFHLDDLNHRIVSFTFGPVESSRPSSISSASLCSNDKTLKQSGKLNQHKLNFSF